MEQVPEISVIIPTYKRPKLLQKAIQSILDQSFSNFNIFVYDNASNDGTDEIVKEFMRKDSRVQYFCHPTNIGMMGNYKQALENINTPFYTLLSDDDFVHPWYLETALADLKKYPDVVFAACSTVIEVEGKVQGEPLQLWSREGYFKNPEGLFEMIRTKQTYPVPLTVMFRTSLACQIPPDLSPEIQVMWDPAYLAMLSAKYPIVTNRKVCGVFDGHQNSFSASFYRTILTEEGINKYIRAHEKMLKNIISINGLIPAHRKKAKKLFQSSIKKEFFVFLDAFHHHKQLKLMLISSYKLAHNFGLTWPIIRINLKTIAHKYFPLLLNAFRKFKLLYGTTSS